MKRKTLVLLLIAAAVILGTLQINMQAVSAAETATVTVSSASGEKGDEVSITVTVNSSSSIYATDVYINYDSSVVEAVSGYDVGGNGVVRWIDTDTFKSKSRTITFKILQVGTTAISVGSGTVIAGDSVMSVSSSSGSIKGTAPVTYSTNNNLASLQISPGILSPAFSTNTTTYTTSVDKDVKKLVVSAIAEDSTATVTVYGANLDPGSNTTTIVVTAQDGGKKTYTIYTTVAVDEQETTKVADYGDIEVKVDGITYKIKSDLSQNPLPSGFEEQDYTYNETRIRAGVGINTKILLMYLETSDKKGTSGYYIYDSVSKTFTLYQEMSQPGTTYIILPITDSMELPDGYTLMESNIAGKTMKVMMNDARTYCLFYGISSTGVTGWFRYCLADETIQIYDGSADGVAYSVAKTVYSGSASFSRFLFGISYRKLFYIASSVAFIILILLLIVWINLGRAYSRNKKAFETAMAGLDEKPDMTAKDFAEIVTTESSDEDDMDVLDNYEEPDGEEDVLLRDDGIIFEEDDVSEASKKTNKRVEFEQLDAGEDGPEIIELEEIEKN